MIIKRFQKTRIVGEYGGIYDSKTDKVLDVDDVEHKLNEQQDEINDLHQENADLLGDKIRSLDELLQLQEENEQLQKELGNFKPVMFQDVRKGTVILYSKGD